MDNINHTLAQRIDWVDGLKGICCLIVVICHTFVTVSGLPNHANANIPIIHNLYDGNFAVSAFIILSTVLTCHGIEQHKDNLLHRYRYIVAKRYFRLAVPVGVVILIMYFANLGGGFYAEEYGAKTGNTWLMHITESWIHLPGCILGAPIQGAYGILRVSWMLPYVFWGTMWVIILDILLRGRGGTVKTVLLIICGYIAWKCDFYYLNVVVGYSFYQMLIGASSRRLRLILMMIAFMLFVLSDCYMYTDKWNMLRAICFVGVVVLSTQAKKLFSIKLLKMLGNISMNIYLLHLFVIYTITCRMADLLVHNIMNTFLIYITTISLTIFIAYLFTRCIEKRLNKLTDALLKVLNCYK